MCVFITCAYSYVSDLLVSSPNKSIFYTYNLYKRIAYNTYKYDAYTYMRLMFKDV